MILPQFLLENIFFLLDFKILVEGIHADTCSQMNFSLKLSFGLNNYRPVKCKYAIVTLHCVYILSFSLFSASLYSLKSPSNISFISISAVSIIISIYFLFSLQVF